MTVMVKSGEVHVIEEPVFENGFISGVKARPRLIWIPPNDGCGVLQAMQGYFFPWLKKHLSGFIHSLTKEQIK